MKHMEGAKKRKGWRQALALLVTLVLVCGLAAPAYAEDAAKAIEVTAGKHTSVALGLPQDAVFTVTPEGSGLSFTVGEDGTVKISAPENAAAGTYQVSASDKTFSVTVIAAAQDSEIMVIADAQDAERTQSKETPVEPTEAAGETTEATEETKDPTGETTDPTEGTTAPTEEATDPSEETTAPTGEATDPTEGTTAPTQEPTQPIIKAPSMGASTMDLADLGSEAFSIGGISNVTLAVDETKTLTSDSTYYYNYHEWSSDDENVATVAGNGNSATVTGIGGGSATITHRYRYFRWSRWSSETCTVEVSPKPSNVVTVQVFVCAEDPETHERYSQEMFDLLGLKALNDSAADKIWFTVGTVQIDLSQLSNSNEDAYIQNSDDWAIVEAALANLNTDCLAGTSADNKGNAVSSYRGQARVSYGQGASTGYTALFKGQAQYNDFVDGTLPEGGAATNYHLDLRFNCNKITFMTGKNNISGTGSNADDFSEIDSRVYITGSIIQPPRDGVTAPEGYKVLPGYYKDPDFTEEIDPIGQPLNKDMTVYVKIVPLDNAVVNYKVAQGEGTVSVDMESFNPATESPTGSTATPDSGWAFEGWYSDEACTTKVNSDPTYVPNAPEGGWKENTNLTFWAKFIPANTTVTVSKNVTGGLGDKDKNFEFTVTVKQGDANADFTIDGASKTGTAFFALRDDQNVKLVVPVGSTVTVTETDYGESNGGYTTSYKINSGEEQDGLEATLEAGTDGDTITFTNHKEASPDTGVLLDSLPYVLILAAVAAGVVLMLFRKRRNRDAD